MKDNIYFFLIGFCYGMAFVLILKKIIETFKKD